MSIYFLGNTQSGSGFAQKIASQLPYTLQALHFDTLEDDLKSILNPGDILIVCGGDGTISFVAETLFRLKLLKAISLVLVASGTGNDCAKSLSLPVEPSAERIRAMVESSKEIAVPLFRYADRSVLLYMGLGIDATILKAVDAWRKGLPKKRWIIRLLYAVAGLRYFFSSKMPSGDLILDGEVFKLSSYSGVLLHNAQTYSGGITLPGSHFEDPSMAAYFFKTPFDLVRLLLAPRMFGLL